MATDGSRIGGLFPGRHLFLFAGTAVRPWRPGKNSLAPSYARKIIVAQAIFQTSWRQGCFYRAVHPFIPAFRGQFFGRNGKNVIANFSFLQSRRCRSLGSRIHFDWIFFWEEMETSQSLAGAHGALPDSHGNGPHCARRSF